MSNITFKPQPKVVVKIGRRGDAGTPVELGTSGDLLRWRYVGANSWTNLYDLQDLELPIASIDGLQTALDNKLPTSYVPAWADVSDKPSTFAPSAHSHAIADTTGLQTALDGKLPTSYVPAWADVSGKPSTFTPATHSHAIADVTSLQTALDGKLPTSYVPAWADVSGKPSTFTPATHSHAIADTTGLQTALDGKQNALSGGTANYLTKWTGTGAIGVSSIFDNGGFVGFGTTNPLSKIHLHDGDILFSNSYAITLPSLSTNRISGEIRGSETGTGDYGFLRLSAGGSGSIGGQSAIDIQGFSSNSLHKNIIRFFTAGNERLRIFNSGNFGVKTTTDAGFDFDVNGAGRFIGPLNLGNATGYAKLNIKSSDQTYLGGLHFTNSAISTTWAWVNDSNAALNFGVAIDPSLGSNFTTRFILDQYGKLGVNSNVTADAILSLRGVFTGVGNYAMIRFGDVTQTTNYQKGAIIYESVNASSTRGKIHLALENTDGATSVALSDAKFTVLSNGSIGFGITSPTAVLHLKAGTATANTAPIKLTAGTNLTTPENGAFEFDGTNLFFTVGGVRKTVTLV